MAEPTPSFDFRAGVLAVWDLVYPQRHRIYLLAAIGIVSAITGAFIPLIIGRFFDALTVASADLTQESIRSAIIMFAVWFGIQALNQVVGWTNRYFGRELPEMFSLSVHSRTIAHLMRLPMSFHKQHRISEIRDIEYRAAGMVSSVMGVGTEVVVGLLSVLIGIGIAFTIHVGLACLLVGGALVYTAVMVRTVRVSAYLHREAAEKWSRALGNASMAVHHVDTVKMAAAEEYEDERIRHSFTGAIASWIKMENVWSRIDAFQRIIVFVVQGSIFASAIFLVLRGSITIGDLVAFNGYALMFLGPLIQIGFSWQRVQNGLTAAAMLQERILKQEPEQYDPKEGVAGVFEGNISFQNVSFRYADGDQDVLRDVSFEARAGETVALVGESGGGKSTIIGLLLGFYFPTSGSVMVDGVDTRRLKLSSYRSQTAVVPQEVALFNDTIETNIKYGSFNATRTQVERATHVAQAEEFIRQLPSGYDTMVGERGVKLSVGQKQRIAVARAVLRDPRILILDEPTSALDARTEHALTQALDELMEKRTTFIIAHRLSTVRKADKIVVLQEGRVAEIGDHAELIAKEDGVYKALYEQHIGLRE